MGPAAVELAGGKKTPAKDAHYPCLRHFALAGLAATSRDALIAARTAAEAGYLLKYLDTLAPGGKSWAAELTAYLERPAAEDRVLVAMGHELRLDLVELMAVALATAVEDDMMVGRALSYLQAPVGGSRPTLGLLHSAFAQLAGASAFAIDAISTGAAVRCGLLVVGNEGSPRPERTVSVPLALCLALRGVFEGWPGTSLLTESSVRCRLPQSIQAAAARYAAWLASGPSRALVIRGGSLLERHATAMGVATAVQLKPVLVNTEGPEQEGHARDALRQAGLGIWAKSTRALPVLSWVLAPGESRNLPRIAGYDGPLIALNGTDGSVTGEGEGILHWALPPPGSDERLLLWQSALEDDGLARDWATTHRHRAGRIAQLASLARQRAALDQRPRPVQEDLKAAAWASEGVGLAPLAQPLLQPVSDAALVVTAQVGKELGDLLARCRARERIGEGLGPSVSARYHPGVKALLCGPSGTGKTLTAGWLATRLAMPLYRVDLASMTSKYIGETEKNLAQLLARAEEVEIILLFDEADSLFGKRTDVKESNDRFANAQTNYLLQRIESFDGIALLTSNSRSRFDAAFMRRLDMVIDFPLPGPEERRSLWLSHLGSAHKLTQQELNQISASADLAGGHIRNAVISAAVRAAGHAIAFSDVAHGIATEYRKLGKQMPPDLLIGSEQSP